MDGRRPRQVTLCRVERRPDIRRELFGQYRGRISPTLTATVIGDYLTTLVRRRRQRGLSWIGVRSRSRSNQQQIRFGAFYPPFSLENADLGWQSPFTYSYSAINTWLGEEVDLSAPNGRCVAGSASQARRTSCACSRRRSTATTPREPSCSGAAGRCMIARRASTTRLPMPPSPSGIGPAPWSAHSAAVRRADRGDRQRARRLCRRRVALREAGARAAGTIRQPRGPGFVPAANGAGEPVHSPWRAGGPTGAARLDRSMDERHNRLDPGRGLGWHDLRVRGARARRRSTRDFSCSRGSCTAPIACPCGTTTFEMYRDGSAPRTYSDDGHAWTRAIAMSARAAQRRRRMARDRLASGPLVVLSPVLDATERQLRDASHSVSTRPADGTPGRRRTSVALPARTLSTESVDNAVENDLKAVAARAALSCLELVKKASKFAYASAIKLFQSYCGLRGSSANREPRERWRSFYPAHDCGQHRNRAKRRRSPRRGSVGV